MTRYPYLAKYKSGTPHQGVTLLMMEYAHGVCLYIPSDLPVDDPRLEDYIGKTFNPSNSEIEVYTGSVIVHGVAASTLGT